jgi:D-alanine transaminase/branched-chain amino acid aminotransferase
MNPIYSVINGEFVLKNEASILISDLSIQRGYGIFDYFRTINYKPVFLEDHLQRFYFSTSEMFMDAGYKSDELKKVIQELIEKNKIPDSGIRITLTGGYSEDGYTQARPNLLITQMPFTFNQDNFNKGTRLITYQHQRQLPQVKTIDYLMAIRLQSFIKENNADDILYYNENEICECPRSNFFIVTKNDKIITPAKNILKGITRKTILGLSEFDVKEGIIKPEDILNIKEAFISSTTKNILPVLKINGREIGDGIPGMVTRKIYDYLFSLKEK